MKEKTVKQALAALITQAGLTQTAIAAALKCSQANVHYHLNSTAKNPRAPADLVNRLQKLLKKHRDAMSPADSDPTEKAA